MKNLQVIPDNKIHHIWSDPDTGEEISINPDFYQDNGTPINETGDDYIYERTEIEI